MEEGDEPRNSKLMSVLMQSMGVEACDTRVIQQLLEFFHRYVIEVLQDASVYSDHANKTEVELEDVRLAIQARVNYSFAPPPSRDVALEMANEKNRIALPLIPEKFGVRLPPEKYCLTSINYRPLPKLQTGSGSKKPRIQQPQQKSGLKDLNQQQQIPPQSEQSYQNQNVQNQSVDQKNQTPAKSKSLFDEDDDYDNDNEKDQKNLNENNANEYNNSNENDDNEGSDPSKKRKREES